MSGEKRRKLRVWLVEPYYGGSHRSWADGYVRNSKHDVTLISHEAQFWKWRMQGSHVTLAELAAETPGPPDVVLASSMTNLPAFLGAARRHVGDARVVLFMHESQLTYPRGPRDREDPTWAFINWVSVTAADLVWFNSDFHFEQFYSELPRLLAQYPDRTHSHLIEHAEGRSEVMPIGVELGGLGEGAKGSPPLILWNHRWEHDKGPDGLVEAVRGLCDGGLAFRLAVCGERFVSDPEPFEDLPRIAGDRLVHWGYADDDRYRELLQDASIVLSTARQEFFGVAVVEAMGAGAVPVLPSRLVYPERPPDPRCLYSGSPVPTLSLLLRDHTLRVLLGARSRASVQRFDWSVVAAAMDDRLRSLVDGTGGDWGISR